MALNVGELSATLSLDDGEFTSGLSGIREQLSSFAATAAGAAIGAGVIAGITEAMQQEKITDTLQAQLGATETVAGSYGETAGDLYASAIVDSVQEGADTVRGIAQQGLLPPEATQGQVQQMGERVAATAAVMGEDVSSVTRAVGQMMRTGIADSAEQALNVLVRGSQNGVNAAEDLLDTFTEYSTQFRNLGLDSQTATGLLQQGLQGGARDADIVADALKEFSIEATAGSDKIRGGFEALGLNADALFAAIGRGGGSASGALDTILDSLRNIEDPAKRNAIAVELFGSQAEDLGQSLYSLDPSTAVKALGDVSNAADKAGSTLHDNASTKVEAFKRSLMQGFVEVLGAQVIPAIAAFVGYLGTVGGALGGAAGFVTQNQAAFIALAAVITTVMLPSLIRLAVQAATTTAAVVAGWGSQLAAGASAAAATVAANATTLAGWAAQGAAATLAAARVVAAWVTMGATAMARAAMMAAAWLISMGPVGLIIAAVVALVALIVKNWDTIKAATLAVWNWLWEKIKWVASKLVQIFLNFSLPGLIIKHWATIKSSTIAVWNWIWEKIKWVAGKLVQIFLNFSLPGLIIKHWNTIKNGTVTAWNAVVGFIRRLPGMIADFFLNWTLVGRIIKHWDSIRAGVATKGQQLLNYVSRLPGMITGYFSGLSSKMYRIGTDIVRGIWNGIKSLGSWLRDKVSSAATSWIPDSVSDALGIGSPSRVMRDEIGRWIPAGIVEGIQRGAPAVDRTMRRLVQLPALQQPALAGTSAAAPGPVPRRPRADRALHIEHWHAGSATPEQTAAALNWRMKARG